MTNTNGPDDPKIIPFSPRKKKRIVARTPLNEPVLNLPPTVKALCLVNIIFFLIISFLPQVIGDEGVYTLSFVPARYFGGEPFGIGGVISPVTHMFIHAGWMHLIINVGTLMAFGTGIERKKGGRKLLAFYFTTGIAGAFAHALVYPEMATPMVGASGAISGLFAGILMMVNEENGARQGYKKLLPFILLWIGISLFFGLFGMPGTDNPVAWTTHIGGFLGGLFFYRPLLQKGYSKTNHY